MKRSLIVACASMAWAALCCFGQSPMDGVTAVVISGPNPGEYTISCTVAAPAMPRTILAGHPYSGEETSRQTKTLPDGTRLVQPGPSAIKYRDAWGRVRTERRALRPMGVLNWKDAPMVPEIVDPVAGFLYYLDTVNRVAHRVRLTQESYRIITAPPDVNFPARITKENDVLRKYEPIGRALVNGIEAQGRRITTTYAAESYGEDSPLVATMEIWTSPELGLTVLSKNTDPRTGEFINEIVNIRRGEPDRALFQVPPEYAIVDEPKIPFTFILAGAGAAKR